MDLPFLKIIKVNLPRFYQALLQTFDDLWNFKGVEKQLTPLITPLDVYLTWTYRLEIRNEAVKLGLSFNNTQVIMLRT